jgi:hypothetical protein
MFKFNRNRRAAPDAMARRSFLKATALGGALAVAAASPARADGWMPWGTCINIDPANEPWGLPDPGSGFGMDKIHGLRFVGRSSIASALDWYFSWHRFGLMNVVTEESEGWVYDKADIIQIGNEPDIPGTADSMDPDTYGWYWNIYRGTYDGYAPLWASAGLGSGLVNAGNFLEAAWPGMDPKPDLIAVHCYDGDANQAMRECDDLWNRFGIPVIVTEWWRPANQVWDMIYALNNPWVGRSTVWHSMYPYSTAMNPGLTGLVDGSGNATDVGASFVSAPDV